MNRYLCLLLLTCLPTFAAQFPDSSTDGQVIVNSNNVSAGSTSLRWDFTNNRLTVGPTGLGSRVDVEGATPAFRLYAGGNPASSFSRLEGFWDSGAQLYYLREIVSGSNAIPFVVGINSGATLTFNTNGTATFSGGLVLGAPKTNVLATTATGAVTNVIYGTGLAWDPTTLTLSATASGSGVTTVVTPLAYSGTNITGFNALTNNATYTLTLTNHCLFNAATFTGLPNTTTNMFFTLGLQQNNAGGWVPKFTNSIITWADGNQPVIRTNANAVSYLYFHTHLFTNGMLVGSANINVQ